MDNYTVYMHILPKDVSGKENDLVYIGITRVKPIQRWANGNGYVANVRFFNAIKKYGWEKFEHLILFVNLSEEDAKQKEIELIAKFDSTNRKFGYNVSPGGNIISKETALKIGKSQTGEKNHRYGKHYVFSNEQKLNMSKAKLGENNPMFGKTQSLETRMKKSAKLMGHPVSEETRKKISKRKKGIKRTPESMQNAWNAVRGKPAKNRKEILCVELNMEFSSIHHAAKQFEVASGNICRALKNKTLCSGFHWEYL